MPDFLIRDVPPELYRKLKARAEAHRQSTEQEALDLLERVLREPAGPLTLDTIDRLRVRGARPLTQELIDQARRSGRP